MSKWLDTQHINGPTINPPVPLPIHTPECARPDFFECGRLATAGQLVALMPVLVNQHADQTSQTPAEHVNDTLQYRSAPSAYSRPPAAHGSKFGWKLEGW